jgi:hypothetical protein
MVVKTAGHHREHQPMLLPQCPGQLLVHGLTLLLALERLYGDLRHAEGPARLLGLGVPADAHGAPHIHVRWYWRLGIGLAVQDEQTRDQGPALLGAL